MNIEWLIDPIPMDNFLGSYWGKKPIHIKRQSPDFYGSIFKLSDLDEILGFSFNNKNVRMASQGEKKSPVIIDGSHRTSICNFYDYYYQGQTVVIQNVHLRWEAIGKMANALSQQIGLPVGTHLYATPENNQGFGIHWDDHDIFALQLEGAKEWCLYDGPESPRKSSSHSEFFKQMIDDPGPPSHEILLKAGDLLYFPRGVTHRARARTEPSLHLTFGIYSVTWEDVLKKAIELHSAEILDRPLAPGLLHEEGNTKNFAAQLAPFYADLAETTDFGHVQTHLAAKVVDSMPVLPDGHFEQLDKLKEISGDTLLEKRAGMSALVLDSEKGPSLVFPGFSHVGSAAQRPTMQYIATTNRFQVNELPGSEDETLPLACDLVAKGLLRIAT